MIPDVQAVQDDMDAREIESLNMISRGFAELGQVNPELAYNVMVDILSGINEYAFFFLPVETCGFVKGFTFPVEIILFVNISPLRKGSSHIDSSGGKLR